MATYRVQLDAGQRGETTVRALTAQGALKQAIKWARDPHVEWEKGDRTEVIVRNVRDEDDYASTTLQF